MSIALFGVDGVDDMTLVALDGMAGVAIGNEGDTCDADVPATDLGDGTPCESASLVASVGGVVDGNASLVAGGVAGIVGGIAGESVQLVAFAFGVAGAVGGAFCGCAFFVAFATTASSAFFVAGDAFFAFGGETCALSAAFGASPFAFAGPPISDKIHLGLLAPGTLFAFSAMPALRGLI